MTLTELLKPIRERVENARKEIKGLGLDMTTFTMSLTSEEEDSEFILGAPLADIEKLLAVVEKLGNELIDLHSQLCEKEHFPRRQCSMCVALNQTESILRGEKCQ